MRKSCTRTFMTNRVSIRCTFARENVPANYRPQAFHEAIDRLEVWSVHVRACRCRERCLQWLWQSENVIAMTGLWTKEVAKKCVL